MLCAFSVLLLSVLHWWYVVAQTYGWNKKKDFHFASFLVLFHDSSTITNITEAVIWVASNLTKRHLLEVDVWGKVHLVPSALPTPEELERSLQAHI